MKDAQMASTVGEPFTAGTLYAVSEVAGHPPVSITDFVGSVSFSIVRHGAAQRVVGTGVPGSTQVLRFYEILDEQADVRIWNVASVAGTGIVAYQVD